MSDEEDFKSESEKEEDDFSVSEEEWLPEKKSKKKGNRKSKLGSSSGDDAGSVSEIDSDDLEDFERRAIKNKGNKAARKRSAPKASPKQEKQSGKRKRLSPGLRDRLYQQYKKDLLKERAPARTPLNTSVADILEKCKFQRKTSTASKSTAVDSDSSGDDHLIDPEKLDLGATFFSKSEPKASGSADGPPEFDVNAGMRLSDSSDGEEEQHIGEEYLPASIPKQAAAKLICHINQQSSEYMNFTNLDQFTAKVEEAKRVLKNYQQKATNANESSGDNAASSSALVESVSSLLAKGEMDAGTSPGNKEHNVCTEASSDSEWEEVHTGDNQNDEQQETNSKPPADSANWQVTIEMDTAQSRRKRREELEMELFIKRQINKVKRHNQLNYHKTSILCAISIGQHLNRIINFDRIRAQMMSIMQNNFCSTRANANWDNKKMQKLVDWFKAEFTLKTSDFLAPPTGCSLNFMLSLALYTRKVACQRDYILLFLVCLRLAGVQARLVLSANVPPKRPAMSDLCPITERKIKENHEKHVTSNEPVKRDSFDKTTAKIVQNHNEDLKKKLPPPKQNIPNVPVGKIPDEKTPKSAATKENPAESVRRSLRSSTAPKVHTERVTRRALTTLNIPQLDGGDDQLENDCATKKIIPLRRVLRSTAKTKAVTSDVSPFAKRQSNTTPTVVDKIPAKSLTNAARKRKLFAASTETQTAPVTRRSTTTMKPVEQKQTRRKMTTETKEPKVKRRTLRPDPPTDDDDAFEAPKHAKQSNAVMKTQVPIVLVNKINLKTYEKDNEKSSIPSSSKKATPVRRKQPKATLQKKTRPITDTSDDSDSDFELHKSEATSSNRKKTAKKASSSVSKANKSPHAGRRKAGEQNVDKKVDLWIEFFSQKEKRWITFDLARGLTDCVDLIVRNATNPISYVFAWDNEARLKDVTARYVKKWNTTCRMLRVEQSWLDKALRPFAHEPTERDLLEEKELDKLLDTEKPVPQTIGELKNHPLYALRRHLLKFEALYPAEPLTFGFVRGEAIYPRECVHTLQTREKWYKQGRVVRPFETTYKVVKCWKYDRPNNTWLKDQRCELFGHWQTDEYDPPTAENGLVPRNEYGNVELFTDKMLPKGTVHLKLPGLNKVCKRLQIDCASAVTGFEMAKMRMIPVYDGFVVCQEFADQLVEEWYKEMEEEERREQEKLEKRIYGNWKRLIKGLLVRRKLQNKYNFDNLAQ
ncbi:DNA repair protein complementing XP-C cells homolog [Anopheles nili]|uniref:DNA repair protein complementing XP-C cells homolog n=1 Tax=Anopheles nili TaxID=185578 RepID=UPI00237B2817|nr:DNA repair protein complementing XP-C cells homolog [Anopheles nili]